MKSLRSFWVICSVGAFLFVPASAAADELTVVASQVVITATVSPRRYVIVDAAGQVEQIISNTSLQAIEPTFYRGTVATGRQILPTLDLHLQVDEILRNTKFRPGVLYQRVQTVKPNYGSGFLASLKKSLK